jgi:Uma2 family endonuclease
MTAATLTTIEAYLHTAYEHDREYVRGEVVERAMPNKSHSAVQAAIVAFFWQLRAATGLVALPELRCRLSPDCVRIPDVAVYGGMPAEEVPGTAPKFVIEVLSPDDRLAAVLEKCEEYAQWGVEHIWLCDPETKRFVRYQNGLRAVERLEAAEYGIAVEPGDIFE